MHIYAHGSIFIEFHVQMCKYVQMCMCNVMCKHAHRMQNTPFLDEIRGCFGGVFSPPNFQQSLRTPQNTPSPLILRPPTHCIALNKRQKESEELVRKSLKKQKLIANTEKLSADELLKKYRNHFK